MSGVKKKTPEKEPKRGSLKQPKKSNSDFVKRVTFALDREMSTMASTSEKRP